MRVPIPEARPGVKYAVDERIAIASPPSVVLDALQRYFNAHGNVLHLSIPLKKIDKLGTVALEERISVEHEAHPSKAMIARYDDRVVFRWTPLEDAGPTFAGRFTIRPQHMGTELELKGWCVAPTLTPGTFLPGAVFDKHTVEAMIRSLLEEVKSVLEAEFETIVAVLGAPAAAERKGRVPQSCC